jgi:hypothetical protein
MAGCCSSIFVNVDPCDYGEVQLALTSGSSTIKTQRLTIGDAGIVPNSRYSYHDSATSQSMTDPWHSIDKSTLPYSVTSTPNAYRSVVVYKSSSDSAPVPERRYRIEVRSQQASHARTLLVYL